jgi:glycerophosphoryl diester phosphodiesterase
MMILEIDRFYLLGHRGDETTYVENTLNAFKLAIELGIDMAEMDIQTTADGVPIIFHDDEMNLKTELAGKVTWNQIQNTIVHVGSRVDKIPRLQDVFELVQPTRLNLLLELKTGVGLETIAQLIKDYHMEDRVIIDSFRMDYLETFQRLMPDLSYMWLIAPPTSSYAISTKQPKIEDILNTVLLKNYVGASFHQNDVTTEVIDAFHRDGKIVFVWGIKSREDYHRLIRQKKQWVHCTRHQVSMRNKK